MVGKTAISYLSRVQICDHKYKFKQVEYRNQDRNRIYS